MSLYNHDYNNRLRDITSPKENTVLTLLAIAAVITWYVYLLMITGAANSFIEYAGTFISSLI